MMEILHHQPTKSPTSSAEPFFYAVKVRESIKKALYLLRTDKYSI
jgi:hypothetical protein